MEATDGLLRAGNIEGAAEAQARLAGALINLGERDPALDCLERARELVEPRGPSYAKAFVLQEFARIVMMADDLPRAIRIARESLELAEQLGLQSARARNLNTIGVSRTAGGDSDGLLDLERALEIAAAANSYEEASAAANLTWMHVLLGDLRRAGELQVRSRATSRRIGLLSFIRWQETEQTFHWHWAGRWDEALAVAQEYLLEIGDSGHYMESAARWIRAAIFMARGDTDAAVAESARAVEVARHAMDPQTINPSIALQAQVALAVGDRALATAVADELVEIWHATGIRQPHELSVAPWVFKELGRDAELLYAVEHEPLGDYPWHEAARKIGSGDLQEAAEIFARMGTVPDEAFTRLKLAEALVAAGDRHGADAQLRLALPVFAQLGAVAWTAEGESLLAESA